MFATKDAPKDYEIMMFEAYYGDEAEFNRGEYDAIIDDE